MLRLMKDRAIRREQQIQAAMRAHPAGKKRLSSGNVRVLPNPGWESMQERMPERVQ